MVVALLAAQVSGMAYCGDRTLKEHIERADSVFSVGDSRSIEIAFPRRGYANTPYVGQHPPSGVPAERDEDFHKKRIRVTVSQKAPAKGGFVVGAEATGLDTGNFLFHALFEVTGTTCLLWSFSSRLPLPHAVERVPPGLSMGPFAYNTPYPFSLTGLPWLFTDKSLASLRQASWLGPETGLAFTESTLTPLPDSRQCIQVVSMERVEDVEDCHPSILRFFDPATGILDDAQAAHKTPVKVLYREVQYWKHTNDWLWESMERVDCMGAPVLRCRQIHE
jgi:hypothetical protein